MKSHNSESHSSLIPEISCIVTAFGEGELARVSIDSILNQSFHNFELLIVDDGADDLTRDVIRSYDDPRIVYIRQANDGLSSARNRALNLARGDYVCFLDADDTRPIWAFETMLQTAKSQNADVVFTAGLLSELRKEILPFYDTSIIESILNVTDGVIDSKSPSFTKSQSLLALLEPQSANKMVRRDFLKKHMLRFPAGLFFEDLVFHMGLVLCAEKVAVTSTPCFTYFRRYGRPQITSSRGVTRFDAITSAGITLNLLENSAYFQSPELRAACLASCFKLVKWSEDNVGHHLKWQYRQAVMAMLLNIDQRYRTSTPEYIRAQLMKVAPWVSHPLDYFSTISREISRSKVV